MVISRDLLVECRRIWSAKIAMATSTINALVHHRRRGTSVLSGTVVLTLIVVAVSLTIPQWLRSRERNTACDAIEYLANVHAAQESYRATHGRYADDLKLLDLAIVPPAYFEVGPIRLSTLRQSPPPNFGQESSAMDDSTVSWSITLKRYAVQTVFAPYSITCSQDGFDEISSDSQGPLSSLQPRINR